ncbi:MAG: hypothetical protein AAB358_00465 [Patescibacteria group bacterium]
MATIIDVEKTISAFREDRSEKNWNIAKEVLAQALLGFGGFAPETKGIIWFQVSPDCQDELTAQNWFGLFEKKPREDRKIVVFPRLLNRERKHTTA